VPFGWKSSTSFSRNRSPTNPGGEGRRDERFSFLPRKVCNLKSSLTTRRRCFHREKERRLLKEAGFPAVLEKKGRATRRTGTGNVPLSGRRVRRGPRRPPNDFKLTT